MLYKEVNSWRPDERFVKLVFRAYMLKKLQAREKGQLVFMSTVAASCLDHTVEFADKQILLIAVMRIKRRAPNVGDLDNIVDCDRTSGQSIKGKSLGYWVYKGNEIRLGTLDFRASGI